MIRVRNEEQFLEAAVRSIADSMDEIVIVDNLSTDGTPDLIARLRQSLGPKVVALRYPFEVARYGEENRRLASTKEGLRSPHLLANYYRWCLARCTQGFVVKWDGDMIATDAFPALIDGLRSTEIAVRYFHGANLHASGTSLIDGLPYEDAEPRVFLRRFARYDNGFDVWERFRSPYDDWPSLGMRDEVPDVAYLHMKYCKRDRFENVSPERVALEQSLAAPGSPLDPTLVASLHRWLPEATFRA